MLFSNGPNKAFLVPDSCRATERNGNSTSANVTNDIIENDWIGNRRQLAKYIIIQHSFPNSPVFANSKSYLEYPILL
jgi:hypothetical protein